MKEITLDHLYEVCEKVAAQCRAEGLAVEASKTIEASWSIEGGHGALNRFGIAWSRMETDRDGALYQAFVPDAWEGDDGGWEDDPTQAVCKAGWKARIIQLVREELDGYLTEHHLENLRFAEECFLGLRRHPLMEKAKRAG